MTGRHGGKRSRHVLPALTPAQVLEVRALRAQGVPYKVIMRSYPGSRETLSYAVHGRKTYKGY